VGDARHTEGNFGGKNPQRRECGGNSIKRPEGKGGVPISKKGEPFSLRKHQGGHENHVTEINTEGRKAGGVTQPASLEGKHY